MSSDEDVTRDDEIRAVPPEEQGAEHARGVATAMKAATKEGRSRFEKELKDLERVNAKHAKRAEKAAADAGVDQHATKGDLDTLRDLPQEQLEARQAELAQKYRPLADKVLKAAGIDPDSLAKEALATVKVPEHAKAVGRRKDAAGNAQSLGWTTEVKES